MDGFIHRMEDFTRDQQKMSRMLHILLLKLAPEESLQVDFPTSTSLSGVNNGAVALPSVGPSSSSRKSEALSLPNSKMSVDY